jgi:hypothetical protein
MYDIEQSQGQMNGFPLEVHCAIWGTWDDNVTKKPPSFKCWGWKICTGFPRPPLLLQCKVLHLGSEIGVFFLSSSFSAQLSALCSLEWEVLKWDSG